MRIRIALTAIVCTCVSGMALYLLLPETNAVAVGTNDDTDTLQEFWTEHVRSKGPQEAYADFVTWVQDVDTPRQHELAHIMGGALYWSAGLAGMAACTSDYSYGCYHEFLGQAIHDQGLPVIETLSETCTEALQSQSLGCQHGIGHGIVGYLGYELESLREALALCGQLGTDELANGCAGGVFMEYNFQSLVSVNGATRAYDEARGPYYPCDALTDQWLSPCYFWQTQWWQALDRERSSYEDRAADMAEWCDAIADPAFERECFRGIGYNAPGELGYDADRAMALCDRMPHAAGVVECRAGAAGTMLANPPSHDIGYAVCEGIPAADRDYCVRTATDPH